MSDLNGPVGPVDAFAVPRYAGLSTFARLPRREDVSSMDIAVVGIPFDSSVTYRPGARFGQAHIRQSSRLLRPYNPALAVSPFGRGAGGRRRRYRGQPIRHSPGDQGHRGGGA